MDNVDQDQLEQGNIDIVNQFCQAWEAKNIQGLLDLLHDNIYYQMWDADDAITVRGKDEFGETVGGFLENMDTVEFEILRTQAMGKIVINERTDRFINDDGRMVFSITGVFALEDGKIIYWKDYLFPGKFRELPF